jgi:hypothetical protein
MKMVSVVLLAQLSKLFGFETDRTHGSWHASRNANESGHVSIFQQAWRKELLQDNLCIESQSRKPESPETWVR